MSRPAASASSSSSSSSSASPPPSLQSLSLAPASSPSPPAAAVAAPIHYPLLCSIGILTDIQCAPSLPIGHNYMKTEVRYYQHALRATHRAMSEFAKTKNRRRRRHVKNDDDDDNSDDDIVPIHSVLHFGDLIDGTNGVIGLQTSIDAMNEIDKVIPQYATDRWITNEGHADVASSSSASSASSASSSSSSSSSSASPPFPSLRLYHLIGNHELMNFPRSYWATKLGIAQLSRQSIIDTDRARLKRRTTGMQTPMEIARIKTPIVYQFPEVNSTDATISSSSSSSSLSSSSSSSSSPPPSLLSSSPSPALASFTSASPLYYSLHLPGNYRFIMLDCYDITVLGYADLPSHPSHVAAVKFLDDNNPNDNKSSPQNMPGMTSRYVAFNGGLGAAQLEWLRSELDDCVVHNHRAVLCSHVAFESQHEWHNCALVWNRDEVLDIVHEYRDCVIACLHGHDHNGGHVVDDDGITHHTFEAILSTPEDTNCHARMDVYEDELVFNGRGRMTSFAIGATKAKNWENELRRREEEESCMTPEERSTYMEKRRKYYSRELVK